MENNENDCTLYMEMKGVPHRCIGLKMFHPACGTVGCPFYKPREFASGYRTIVDGEVKFRKKKQEVSDE